MLCSCYIRAMPPGHESWRLDGLIDELMGIGNGIWQSKFVSFNTMSYVRTINVMSWGGVSPHIRSSVHVFRRSLNVMRYLSVNEMTYLYCVSLKGEDSEKKVWLRRFSIPSIDTSLWNVFHISKITRSLDENVSLLTY